MTSIMSVLFLVVAIPITVYILQNQKFNFQINAFLNDEPQSISVVDVRGASVKITWMTEKSVIGMVKLSGDSTKTFFEKESSSFHLVEVRNLQPGQEYTFSLLSDGVEYSKPEYKFTTASILDEAGSSYLVYGQVFSVDGSTIQPSGLAYVQMNDGGKLSDKVPAVLNKAGGFQINLAGVLKSDHSGIFEYKKNLEVSVEVNFEVGKPSVTKKFTVDLSNNHQIPNIYLGDINIDVIPGINGN